MTDWRLPVFPKRGELSSLMFRYVGPAVALHSRYQIIRPNSAAPDEFLAQRHVFIPHVLWNINTNMFNIRSGLLRVISALQQEWKRRWRRLKSRSFPGHSCSSQSREPAAALCILTVSKCTRARRMKFNDSCVGSAENHWRLQYFWLIW